MGFDSAQTLLRFEPDLYIVTLLEALSVPKFKLFESIMGFDGDKHFWGSGLIHCKVLGGLSLTLRGKKC